MSKNSASTFEDYDFRSFPFLLLPYAPMNYATFLFVDANYRLDLYSASNGAHSDAIDQILQAYLAAKRVQINAAWHLKQAKKNPRSVAHNTARAIFHWTAAWLQERRLELRAAIARRKLGESLKALKQANTVVVNETHETALKYGFNALMLSIWPLITAASSRGESQAECLQLEYNHFRHLPLEWDHGQLDGANKELTGITAKVFKALEQAGLNPRFSSTDWDCQLIVSWDPANPPGEPPLNNITG